MGLFSSKKNPKDERKPGQGRNTGAPSGGLSIVGADMTVRGDLETNGVVKVEGTVDGHVKAITQVLVAKGGVVHGDIETTEAVIGGIVNGAIRAKERVEVQAGASVQGDITTRRIAVAEGGSLNGLIRMDDGASARESSREERPAEARLRAPPLQSRPSSVPVARIAVPPRASSQGQG
jgi:cytoskeletal protein CcmA (bactofilin family)